MLAFVWLARSGATAFELYGGVSAEGQKQRVNYGVKWAALQAMRADGCSRYDFNGLLNDGISDFKKQFAKHENLLLGTWDKPLVAVLPGLLQSDAAGPARPAGRPARGEGRCWPDPAGSGPPAEALVPGRKAGGHREGEDRLGAARGAVHVHRRLGGRRGTRCRRAYRCRSPLGESR